MILVFGGAYQGKLKYAQEQWNFKDEDVFRCEETLDIDWNKKVFYGFEKYIYAATLAGNEVRQDLEGRIAALQDKIFILCDVSQGIVPMEADRRAWREHVGRTMLYLSGQAGEVHRVFCGLGQKLKEQPAALSQAELESLSALVVDGLFSLKRAKDLEDLQCSGCGCNCDLSDPDCPRGQGSANRLRNYIGQIR